VGPSSTLCLHHQSCHHLLLTMSLFSSTHHFVGANPTIKNENKIENKIF
jgi:hypothetical protein